MKPKHNEDKTIQSTNAAFLKSFFLSHAKLLNEKKNDTRNNFQNTPGEFFLLMWKYLQLLFSKTCQNRNSWNGSFLEQNGKQVTRKKLFRSDSSPDLFLPEILHPLSSMMAWILDSVNVHYKSSKPEIQNALFKIFIFKCHTQLLSTDLKNWNAHIGAQLIGFQWLSDLENKLYPAKPNLKKYASDLKKAPFSDPYFLSWIGRLFRPRKYDIPPRAHCKKGSLWLEKGSIFRSLFCGWFGWLFRTKVYDLLCKLQCEETCIWFENSSVVSSIILGSFGSLFTPKIYDLSCKVQCEKACLWFENGSIFSSTVLGWLGWFENSSNSHFCKSDAYFFTLRSAGYVSFYGSKKPSKPA